MKKAMKENRILTLLAAIVGGLIYAIGMNLFILPQKMYSSGLMGVSQLVEYAIRNVLHFQLKNIDMTGVVYYILNVPVLCLGLRSIGKRFMVRTIICATAMSFFMSIIPVPEVAIMGDDVLASGIIGGLCTGVGEGLTLYFGSSMGGLDIVGILLTRKKKDFSIGKVFMVVNFTVYAICLFLFDIKIVLYSLIIAAISSFAIDRVHMQNINVEVKVITKYRGKDLQDEIMESLYRGITRWEGKGAYTEENEYIFYILMSKYEVDELREIVMKYDSKAFIIVNEQVAVDGNFIKKL